MGLFFDYYDLYLFVYLEKSIAAQFALTTAQSNWLQFGSMAGVGMGALGFGYLADRFGRGRVMLIVFALYAVGVAGLSLAWSVGSLGCFRLLASFALGAEWGISHTYLAERVTGNKRYRFSALLQFSILGGLLAALVTRYALPVVGWRWLFAASILPIAILSLLRGKALANDGPAAVRDRRKPASLARIVLHHRGAFALCFALASLTIASGYLNIFFVKELPQSVFYTVLFWINVVPGMLVGAWIVRRWGVARALLIYALGLFMLSLACWMDGSLRAKLGFALALPLLNGIPFGLMGAYFNEVFGAYRTMLSGAAYNLGRIAAGFAPWVITALGLHEHGRYFLFTAAIGVGVLGVAILIGRQPRGAVELKQN